jgi:hypothetical protein
MVVLFRQRIMIGWAVVGAFAAMAFGGATAVGASPQAPTPAANGTFPTTAGVERSHDVINLLDPYVLRSADGTLSLQPPPALAKEVGAPAIAELTAGLAGLNVQIRAGKLATTSDHRVYDPAVRSLSVQGGWTGFRYYWWGWQAWLNEFWTQRLLAVIAIGGGLATYCALGVATSIPCGAIIAIAATFGGVIWLFDWGNGITVVWPYLGGWYINPQ